MSQAMKRKYADKNNILLVNITRLGDMLQATPAISGMKMENPNCKITVLVEKQFESICHWLPDIDKVLTLDLGMTVRSMVQGTEGIIEAFEYVDEFVKQLRAMNFDYVLNMSSSAYTALLLKLVGVDRHGGWMSDDEGNRVIESEWAKLFATSVFHDNRRFNSINLVDVFRCSADVEAHPHKLQVIIDPKEQVFVNNLLSEGGLEGKGPLIAIQAGASQGKRQWDPKLFIELVKILIQRADARVVLTGTSKEMHIVDPIAKGVDSKNVFVAAGKTNIPQLAALLEQCEVLITGDTGPMHISVAAGTPVIAMFLASAYGFETGPYSEGNIVLQPVIVCGPCNPNKPCSRPDCHEHINPEMLADLTLRRVAGDFKELPAGYADPGKLIIYRSFFDEYGFCDMQPLNGDSSDPFRKYRAAYRQLWLDDLAGLKPRQNGAPAQPVTALRVYEGDIEGLHKVVKLAQQGALLIDRLTHLIQDSRAPAEQLSQVNSQITELDRVIEQTGFHYAAAGPVTRMFIFAKENISGSNPISLASQMRGHYKTLEQRCIKLNEYFALQN